MLITACQHAQLVRLALCKKSQHLKLLGLLWPPASMAVAEVVKPSIRVLQVKSCLVFEKTALPADSTAWVAGR